MAEIGSSFRLARWIESLEVTKDEDECDEKARKSQLTCNRFSIVFFVGNLQMFCVELCFVVHNLNLFWCRGVRRGGLFGSTNGSRLGKISKSLRFDV